MDIMTQSKSGLLQLPAPCLEAVLRCCANNPHSLFSTARPHSRLRQAVALEVSRNAKDIGMMYLIFARWVGLTPDCTLAQIPSFQALPLRVQLAASTLSQRTSTCRLHCLFLGKPWVHS
jgi:hypothetical protein